MPQDYHNGYIYHDCNQDCHTEEHSQLSLRVESKLFSALGANIPRVMAHIAAAAQAALAVFPSEH